MLVSSNKWDKQLNSWQTTVVALLFHTCYLCGYCCLASRVAVHMTCDLQFKASNISFWLYLFWVTQEIQMHQLSKLVILICVFFVSLLLFICVCCFFKLCSLFVLLSFSSICCCLLAPNNSWRCWKPNLNYLMSKWGNSNGMGSHQFLCCFLLCCLFCVVRFCLFVPFWFCYCLLFSSFFTW